jgi:hypothetical protein
MNKKEEIELLTTKLRHMSLPGELPSELSYLKHSYKVLKEKLISANECKDEFLYQKLIDELERKALFWAKTSPEEWIAVEDEEYERISHLIESVPLEPISEHSSLHIYEERYLIENETYRLISPIGEDENPLMEKLI